MFDRAEPDPNLVATATPLAAFPSKKLASSPVSDRLAIAAIGIVGVLALLSFRDYGLSWDDYVHAEYGDLLLSFYASGFRDQRALSWVNLYYYGGGFDPFYGTQRYTVSVRIWQPGEPVAQSLRRLAHSVMMVLTVNDPPRFDVYALPILAGALVALLSLAGVPRLRDLPAAAVLFFFASIASAFVAAGWAYTGRFSVHVMPITCALAVCGVASLLGRGRPRRRSS